VSELREVAEAIYERWRQQEERAVAWQRLAARARAATTHEERDEIRRERARLDTPRVTDWGDLRARLGRALGRE